jgi:hypothetical protein
MYADNLVKDFTFSRNADETLALIIDSVTDGVGWMYVRDPEDGSIDVINLASANVLNVSQIESEEEYEVF